MNKRFHELMHKYILGEVNEEEFREFEQFLEQDAELRQEYLNYTMMEADLRSLALEEQVASTANRRIRFPAWAAAAIILIIPALMLFNQSASVAVITSSESAAWESSLPTLPGSELQPGVLDLKTGVATLSFHSGADVMLEAPAKIEIVSTMELNALSGVISIHVSDSAKGFRVNTPNGHAIDHGTRFSVSVSEDDKLAEFEVQEGEISLHHHSGEVQYLLAGQALNMNVDALTEAADPLFEGFIQNATRSVVFSSAGNETSVIRCNDRRRLNPEYLMVKTQDSSRGVERRALFAFEIAGHDSGIIDNARITLNAVPTGLGKVGTMPLESEFELYGISGADERWSRDFLSWTDAPRIEGAELLTTFTLGRSELRKQLALESEDLSDFIRSDQTGSIGFILACKTNGGTLVHGFASSMNSEASGPQLELISGE